jgi:pimeloyl-ACP methyl ester carboxylesterase
MSEPRQIRVRDGRNLEVTDTGEASAVNGVVVWHNGSPHTGALLEPVVAVCAARGLRVVTYARPSYGASTPKPGRTVGDAAGDVAAIVDALGIDRFLVLGASGGGPHALACAARLPDRVTGLATFASPAPDVPDIDWLAGMQAPGALESARLGRPARAAFAETDTFDEAIFTPADWAALAGQWAAVGRDAGAADANGPGGLIDDDVAFAQPWGVDLAAIRAPAVIAQGTEDRVIPRRHGEWLGRHVPGAELWLREGDGHVSVMDAIPAAIDRLLGRTGGAIGDTRGVMDADGHAAEEQR